MRSLSAFLTTTATAAMLVATPACSDEPAIAGGLLGVDGSDSGEVNDVGLLPDAVADAGDLDATPEPDTSIDSGADAPIDTVDEDAVEPDATDASTDSETTDTAPDIADVADTDRDDVPVDADDVEEDTRSPIWEPPASADAYPFATPGALISALSFAAPGTGLSVDADATPDNALGDLLRSLEGLLGINIDELLEESINDGLLTIGLAWVGESPVEEGARSEVHILQLNDVDNNPSTRDSYYVEAASFEPGTGEPTARFPGVTRAGVFVSGRSSFELTVPTGLFDLDLSVQQALVQASPEFDLLGVAVETGRIAGVVPGENIFSALNGYVASPQCSCVSAPGPVYDVGDEGRASCDAPNVDACVSGDPCAQIASLCGIVIQLVTNSYDQDTGGGPANDGMSVNLVFDSVGTSLAGLAP